MGKLKDAHVFSNGEGSIAKFFVGMFAYVAAAVTPSIIISLVEKEPIKWKDVLLSIVILVTFLTVIYFIARFIAYRTRLFPKTENREGIHGVSFIFLIVISIILAILFA